MRSLPPYLSGMIFTTREKQVMELMANDHSKAEIAEIMDISKRTVESYQNKVKAKMGVRMLYTALFKFGEMNGNPVLERNIE